MTSKSLRSYLLIQFIFMVISATATMFIYYYVVDHYFFGLMDSKYLEPGDVDNIRYTDVPSSWFDEYGLTIEVVDKKLEVIYSAGLKPGMHTRYSMSDLVEICSTDTWRRYVFKTSEYSETGEELLVIWIQDTPEQKFQGLQYELKLMIALILLGIIIITVIFVFIYFNRIYNTLEDEFLYIRDEITRLPHLKNKINTGRFHLTEAGQLAGTYNNAVDEMNRIRAENNEIINNSYQLITNLSHDIKTPLTSLSGYTGLLKERLEPDEMAEYISCIERSIKDLNKIVQMLFEQVRLKRTQIVLKKAEWDINDILRDVCANFYTVFSRRGFTFSVDIGENPIVIRLDRTNIKRVFNNILDNFLKHNEAPADVLVSSETTADCVIIKLMNNGRKIPDDIKEMIFTPYFHANEKSPGQSSGLGLYIAESIVEKHGGSISLTETEEYSTVFRIILPLA